MKVIVFGATGGTGLELVSQALKNGYTTSVFIHKHAEALEHFTNKITIYHGDVRDFQSTNTAIKGQDAVLVALGVVPGVGTDVLSAGSANIVRAMQENSVKRIVVETGASLAEDRSTLPLLYKTMSAIPPMKYMFDAKREQEQVIKESGLDWILVRPANLNNGKLTKKYKTGASLHLRVKSQVSRADVAHFMIEQLTHDTWLHKAVTITGS